MNWESLVKNQNVILTLENKLNFGKHKGKTIDEILHEDPTYIRWCLENIDWFKLSKKDEKTVYILSEYCDREMEDYDDWGAWGDLF